MTWPRWAPSRAVDGVDHVCFGEGVRPGREVGDERVRKGEDVGVAREVQLLVGLIGEREEALAERRLGFKARQIGGVDAAHAALWGREEAHAVLAQRLRNLRCVDAVDGQAVIGLASGAVQQLDRCELPPVGRLYGGVALEDSQEHSGPNARRRRGRLVPLGERRGWALGPR